MAPKTPVLNDTRPSGRIFGSPLGPQNRQKMRLFRKMRVMWQSFCRFLLGRPPQPTFSSIFRRFLNKKSMFFSSMFSVTPCIVLDMATLTKHCKTRIETNLFVFLFFVFFGKKWSKIQAKKTYPKK